jgi:hypothetical protein
MQNTINRKTQQSTAPTYSRYRRLPEQERWEIYGQAKRERDAMQLSGAQLSETYDQFVRRVTAELEI